VIETPSGDLILEVFEDGVPPRFRLRAASGQAPSAETTRITTVRPGGARQEFALVARGDFLESVATIPEPHAFTAQVSFGADTYTASSRNMPTHTAQPAGTTTCARPSST
jgi:nickel/cobalt exporter